jgi:hypothetical protein
MIGLKGGRVRPPLVDLRPEDRETLKASLPRWKPWI